MTPKNTRGSHDPHRRDLLLAAAVAVAIAAGIALTLGAGAWLPPEAAMLIGP